MINSLGDDAHRRAPTSNLSQFISRDIVPSNPPRGQLQFSAFSRVLEPVEAMCVSYSGTALDDKVRTSIRVSHFPIAERFHMTLSPAHISPIMSVIAGLLILIMPRLLNLVVAIFLILNGLIGLGLLKWLHI
jgi:hypothetical protein